MYWPSDHKLTQLLLDYCCIMNCKSTNNSFVGRDMKTLRRNVQSLPFASLTLLTCRRS
jgi:hypothetical protein